MSKIKWKIAQFFEVIWWKQYLKNKNHDEYKAWKDKYWTDFLAKIEGGKYLNGAKTVLDAGCGISGIFTVLDNYEVTAIDPLLNQYRDTLTYPGYQTGHKVEFHHSGIEDFNSGKQFDVVFCLNVLNHVNDILRAVDNLISLTSGGGYLIVSLDSHRYNFFNRLFNLLPFDILHPHQYTHKEYLSMFADTGLVKLEKAITIERHVMFDYDVLVLKKL